MPTLLGGMKIGAATMHNSVEVSYKTKNRVKNDPILLTPGHISGQSEVAQSCPTLCNPMDCSPPSSSIHGIFQARIVEWVAISFSRGSFPPRNQTRVFYTAADSLPSVSPGKLFIWTKL